MQGSGDEGDGEMGRGGDGGKEEELVSLSSLSSLSPYPPTLKLDKTGQPCIKDPRYPTNNSEEGCPVLSDFLSPPCLFTQHCTSVLATRVECEMQIRKFAAPLWDRLKEKARITSHH